MPSEMTERATILTDPVEAGEKLDVLLASLGDLHELPAIERVARPLLHTVIVALEGAQQRVAELEADREQTAAFVPNDDGQRFEPGKRYLTANECFVFHCERVVAGVALGVEVRTDGRPGFTSQRVYHSVMPEGCWFEMDADDKPIRPAGHVKADDGDET